MTAPDRPVDLSALVVLPDLPLVEGGAPGRFFVALLKGLRANGVDARAIAARRFFTPPGEIPADLSVEVVRVEAAGRWPSRARRLVRPKGELSWGEFGARVREASRTAAVVHLETSQTAWCDRRVSVPSALHLHYLARHDRPYGVPWRKRFWQVAEETLAERTALLRHRHLVASSPVIAGALRARAPRALVTLAPLCLTPEHYRPAPLDGPATAGIVGTATWTPTTSAVQRLLERIWPLVHRQLPEARLLIAGRGTRDLVAAPPPGVQVLGEIASAADFMRGLSLLLYPVERGSGMKVKVLEALATGVPIVTTPAGAEGIEPTAAVVVAEDESSLARAAVSILRDAAERRERGDAALRTFQTLYTPAVATRPLIDLYRQMLASS